MDRNTTSNDYAKRLDIAGIDGCVRGFSGFISCAPRTLEVRNEEHEVHTACRACIANCGVIATVKNGRVVALRGDPVDPMSKGKLCDKGLSGINALYHPNRNKYPLLRVGERGSGEWKRTTWDNAVDIVARRLMEIREKYGAECVFGSTGGGGNPEVWSCARFCNIFGTPNWFEPGSAQCYLPRVLATTMMYGGMDSSIADSNCLEFYDTESTPLKTLVLWGTDPSYSCPASGGRMVNELRMKGVKTVAVDPRFTPDAAKADVWLPVRPGSDVALLMAWIRYILVNKLYDEDFVLRWTNLPYLVDCETRFVIHPDGSTSALVWDKKTNSAKTLSYPWDDALEPELFGEHVIDGKLYKTGAQLLFERVEEFTLERAAELCLLDPADIEKAIRLYAENTPSSLCLGVATDQGINSEQAAMAAVTLDLLMGNVEKPGAAMQRFRISGVLKSPNYPVPVALKCLPEEQFLKRLGGREHKGLSIWYGGHAASILNAILTGEPYQPRAWIDRSGNKFGVLAEVGKWEEACRKLDFIVHIFTYPTSMTAYADVVLPTEEWLETEMVVETCNMCVARQQCDHVFETRDEGVIWADIARRCGELGHEMCRKAFDPGFMGDDLAYWSSMEEFFDQITPAQGVTWKEYCAKAPFEFLPKDEWKSYYVYLTPDKDGIPQGFPTPSRKCEVYCDAYIKLGRTGEPFMPYPMPPADADYEPLPYYAEPTESPLDNELVERFPLVMTGGRLPMYHHSTLRNMPGMRGTAPVPELWICPEDAEKYGVRSGEWVWVESARGRTRARALVTKAIRPGTVYMERFWYPETLDTPTHGWKESNVNVLTRSGPPFNDVVGTHVLRGFLVRVYPAESAPEGIYTAPEDFSGWLENGKGRRT
ncbi:MAG: molybdopterin-dependent oxidoreductase [Oscillospiraceae bacterium]|nr:molybdopterin-dependent oxidoreductase [Oscillospiraceae bacterium]